MTQALRWGLDGEDAAVRYDRQLRNLTGDARIRYRPAQTGDHIIGASCLGLHQGTFTLTVREEQ